MSPRLSFSRQFPFLSTRPSGSQSIQSAVPRISEQTLNAASGRTLGDTDDDWTLSAETRCSVGHKVSVSWRHSVVSMHPHDMAVGCLTRCPDCPDPTTSRVMFLPFPQTSVTRNDEAANDYAREIAALDGEAVVLPDQLQRLQPNTTPHENVIWAGPEFVSRDVGSPGSNYMVNGDSSKVLRLSILSASRTTRDRDAEPMYLQYVNVDNSQLPPSSTGTGRSFNNLLRTRNATIRRLSQRVSRHGRTAAASGRITGAEVTPIPTALLTAMPEGGTIATRSPVELETNEWVPEGAVSTVLGPEQSDLPAIANTPVELGNSSHESETTGASESTVTPPPCSALAGPVQTHLPNDPMMPDSSRQ